LLRPTAAYLEGGTPNKNMGFYVVGPQPPDMYRAGSDPTLPTSVLKPTMSIRIPNANINLADVRPTILLQRLNRLCGTVRRCFNRWRRIVGAHPQG